MYRILEKKTLAPSVIEMQIDAPLVARSAQAGQFIILRVDADGERIPLTVAGQDRARGSVKIIFGAVGATTMRLARKEAGDHVEDFVGPLGRPTVTENIRRALVVGGGVGTAIALPVAEKLHGEGKFVHSIVGFRNKDLVILKEDFAACSDLFDLVTDDGSAGRKALVTLPLKEALEKGGYDCMIAIGPLPMMKYAVETCRPYGIRTVVSMNPIMIDGTGMCGCCRLTVGGKMRFACVDGPDFDGYAVDFDEAIARSGQYREEEARRREEACRLFEGVK